MPSIRSNLGRWLAVCTAMFVLLNLVLLVAEGRQTTGPIRRYGIDRFAKAHPGWSEADLKILDEESFGPHLALRYHPFAAYRTPAVAGRFVNVAEPGYRRHRDLPWPPPLGGCSVFLFGGSTAFGLALSDAEGLGAALDEEIRHLVDPSCAVYNFSVPAHFSSTEQGLLLDLLREGAQPRLAVFVDGMNDLVYPDGRPEMFNFLDHVVSRRGRWDLVYGLPMVRWAQAARSALRQRRQNAASEGADSSSEDARRSIDRWLRNRPMTQAAAASRGVATLFVIQPSPAYHYDLRHHLFAEGDLSRLGRHRAAAVGYEMLSGRIEHGDGDVLWLADLQQGRDENLYVDMVHYTAAFSRDIAREIARAAGPKLRPQTAIN